MKRITLFSGHYGSGKTNIAINYALALRKEGKRVAIGDLDIVNPYFRTKDSEDELKKSGVEVISLPFANSNVDLPSIPSEAYSLVENRERYAVLDIGGDERGALALGRFVPYILEENNYEMVFVVNFYRPLTRNAKEAFGVLREIENACGLRFTTILNNSNLGAETKLSDIEKTKEKVEELEALSGLKCAGTTCEKSIANSAMFPIHLQRRAFE